MSNPERLFKVSDVQTYDGYTATKLELIDLVDNDDISKEHFFNEMSRLARYYKREYLDRESITRPDKIIKYAEVMNATEKVKAIMEMKPGKE